MLLYPCTHFRTALPNRHCIKRGAENPPKTADTITPCAAKSPPACGAVVRSSVRSPHDHTKRHPPRACVVTGPGCLAGRLAEQQPHSSTTAAPRSTQLWPPQALSCGGRRSPVEQHRSVLTPGPSGHQTHRTGNPTSGPDRCLEPKWLWTIILLHVILSCIIF